MSAPACPSCGRPLGRRLADCPYCGEHIPGATWRAAAPAMALAAVLAIEAAAMARMGPRRFLGVFRALPHQPHAPVVLTLAAIAVFAPFPKPLPGAAAVGRTRRAIAIATRLIAILLLAKFLCDSAQ